MRLAILTAAVLLAGCASPEQLRATVGNASNFQLCRAILLAPSDVAGIARDEAGRRRLDCAPYSAAVLQNERASDAATNAYVQRLLTPPQPMPFPAQRSCRTIYKGSGIYDTVCD